MANNRFVRFFFFGNYFYGLCAIALSVEASLQQGLGLNTWIYYLFIFFATVAFYSKAYLKTENSENITNERSQWYQLNNQLLKWTMLIYLVLLVILAAIFVWRHLLICLELNLTDWFLLLVFPLVGVMYYGINYGPLTQYKLRNIGWLKPFIIGFCWAGLVTFYPAIFYQIEQNEPQNFLMIRFLLFIKNFMYITVLCIMFDIKDYAMDYNHRLKTFVVKAGLRKTIYSIIIPLTIMGLFSFLAYAIIKNFNFYKILLNTIPFIAILSVAYSLQNRHSIFYYLIIIDGLMLLKAICGITAMLFF